MKICLLNESTAHVRQHNRLVVRMPKSTRRTHLTTNTQIDWSTLRQTGWEPQEDPGTGAGVLLRKSYFVKRMDGFPLNIFLTVLPGEAGFICADMEICAMWALRSYDGCGCTMDAPCKPHAQPLDVRQFRGLHEDYQSPEGLRAWLLGARPEAATI